ncbi:hypothetical protein PR202_ga04725 [Eleusine coracana subsp. coracana]|uniref:Cation/H+ exchanger domain-containing protein n=1 Tax=Eleusine coracana subsp. coracana TaxID=191504 RepID=A0AAV5BSI1_ELECO|nr:hypothetical protein PR202_ga04725 [Eleusine coracana subsp. coracana]
MAHDVDVKCNPEVRDGSYFMGSLMAVTGIMATILALSGIFHSALRRLGQPSIVSHILAGIMVGPTFLGRAMDLQQLGMHNAGSALRGIIYFIRIVFMFFIGLELDLVYLRHNLRRSVAVACGGSAVCLVLAALGGPFLYGLLHPDQASFHPDRIYASTALFMLFLTSTASPVLIRVVTELKLTASETGQLAIGAAFANDMASLAAFSVMSINYTLTAPRTKKQQQQPSSTSAKATVVAGIAATVWVAMSATAWAARRLNRRKRGRQHVSKYELCGMLLLIVGLSVVEQGMGYSPSMTAFLIGLAMPREGPTARTIRDRLAYPVHQVITPLCFAVIGARLDFAHAGTTTHFTAAQFAAAVVFTTLLGAAGKVAGTVVAVKALGITAREGVMLGALLNVKGYTDVLAINFGDRTGVWGETAQAVLLVSSVLNTLAVGPTSAAIARWQRRAHRYRSRRLQDLVRPDQELRLLACVHGAVDVHPMLTLAHLARSAAPLTVHLLHLVELVTARKYAITDQLYHANENNDDDDEWGYARDIERVAAAVACFTYDHVVPVRQATAVASVATMDADVRNGADDARASLVLVPFHRELRYDGRMVCRREGRRQLNRRVLHRPPPCTVGVFVERRLFDDPSTTTTTTGDQQPVHHVAAVFLGGADDREAVAYAARVAAHPSATVTVCRLRPTSGCPPIIATGEAEAAADEKFMAEIHDRLVAPGRVAYTETHVSNGAETVSALTAMAREFSLLVVGRASGGSASAEAMTCGMGDDFDNECPELGPVGELLASDDVAGGGSVLVLQQHCPRHRMRTWNDPSSSGAAADAVVDIYKDPPPSLFTTKLTAEPS